MGRFPRAVALPAQGQVAQPEKAHAEFRDAKSKIQIDRMLAINPAQRIFEIADHVIAGEIVFRQGKVDEAVAQLRQAAAIEDDLTYMEPPEWTLPVRHTLGAILMHARRYAEADQVYRADLAKWPENGWSLFGLAKALQAKGSTAEANQIERRFNKAWSKADTKITFTCLCVREKP